MSATERKQQFVPRATSPGAAGAHITLPPPPLPLPFLRPLPRVRFGITQWLSPLAVSLSCPPLTFSPGVPVARALPEDAGNSCANGPRPRRARACLGRPPAAAPVTEGAVGVVLRLGFCLPPPSGGDGCGRVIYGKIMQYS